MDSLSVVFWVGKKVIYLNCIDGLCLRSDSLCFFLVNGNDGGDDDVLSIVSVGFMAYSLRFLDPDVLVVELWWHCS